MFTFITNLLVGFTYIYFNLQISLTTSLESFTMRTNVLKGGSQMKRKIEPVKFVKVPVYTPEQLASVYRKYGYIPTKKAR